MADDFSTYEGRQAYRDAHPGAIVDASGAYYPSSGQTVSAGSQPAAPTTTVSASQQLGSQVNSLLGAIASGNKQAFDEAVRQFNATFGLDQQKFQEAIRQYNEGLAVSAAGLTGQYQGQTTLQNQLQQANIAAQQAGLTGFYQAPPSQQTYMHARSEQLQGMGWSPEAAWQTADAEWKQGLAQSGYVAGGLPSALQGEETLASKLQTANIVAQRNQTAQNWAQLYGYTPQIDANGNPVIVGAAGPGGQPATTLAAQQQQYAQQMGMINQAAQLQANPFRQQQAIGQMNRLLGGQGVAGFSAPTTVQGVGTAGGNTQGGLGYLQQMIEDIRNPAANTSSMNEVLQGIPTPNKLNSNEFLRAAPSTQNLVLQGMQEKYGLDPQDALAQIKNTLPQFQSPTTFGKVGR